MLVILCNSLSSPLLPHLISPSLCNFNSLLTFIRSGDGTGVGKGRQIAAILADNFMKGRKKGIWFSVSATLFKVHLTLFNSCSS